MCATDILDLNDYLGDAHLEISEMCWKAHARSIGRLSPSYIISVTDNEEEYMIAVVCPRSEGKVVKSFAVTKKNPTR